MQLNYIYLLNYPKIFVKKKCPRMLQNFVLSEQKNRNLFPRNTESFFMAKSELI